MGAQGDPQGIVQEIEFWPYEQMVYAPSRICPEEWNAPTSLGFLDTNGSFNFRQTTRTSNNQEKKKRTYQIVDFAVSANHRVKLKENEKKDKYLARGLKKLLNMKVTVITIVIGALGTVNKWLVQELENTEKSPGDLRNNL